MGRLARLMGSTRVWTRQSPAPPRRAPGKDWQQPRYGSHWALMGFQVAPGASCSSCHQGTMSPYSACTSPAPPAWPLFHFQPSHNSAEPCVRRPGSCRTCLRTRLPPPLKPPVRCYLQGQDPATDLRGCGMLGLLQLLHLSAWSPEDAAKMYALSRHSVQVRLPSSRVL
jgi:hypothetical protein